MPSRNTTLLSGPAAMVTASSNSMPPLRSESERTGAVSLRGWTDGRARGHRLANLGCRPAIVPDDAGLNDFEPNPRAEAVHGFQHRIDQLVREPVRAQAQLQQTRVRHLVVVIFLLHPRILQMLNLARQPELAGAGCHQLGQLVYRENLGELVEDAVLAGRSRASSTQRSVSRMFRKPRFCAPWP